MANRSATPTYGAPSERLQQLLLATHTPESWDVTDQIVITAPTKKRRQQMSDAQMSIAVQQQLLSEAIKHVLANRPEYPSPPTPPDAGASKAVYAAYEAAVAGFDNLVSTWNHLNQEWEDSVERHQQVVQSISDSIAEASDSYTKGLFGAAYDDVIAYFDEQPAELWQAFQAEIQYHFKLAVRPPEIPDDGKCPSCGQVEDGEQAGKAPASSRSSKRTGKQ